MKSLRDRIDAEWVKEKETWFNGNTCELKRLKKYFRVSNYFSSSGNIILWRFRVDLIEEMERLRCDIFKRYNDFLKFKRTPYLKKCLDMGLSTIYSYITDTSVPNTALRSFTFYNDGSVLDQTHALNGYDKTIKFCIMDDTDLPLYINDTSLSSEEITYIRRRFDRKEKKWELRPELVHEYLMMERRQRRLFTALGCCNYILKKYVNKHYQDENAYVKLVFGCREYLYSVADGDVELVTTPESKILTRQF